MELFVCLVHTDVNMWSLSSEQVGYCRVSGEGGCCRRLVPHSTNPMWTLWTCSVAINGTVCLFSSYRRQHVISLQWTSGWLPSVQWGWMSQAAGPTLHQSRTNTPAQSSTSPLLSMARSMRHIVIFTPTTTVRARPRPTLSWILHFIINYL